MSSNIYLNNVADLFIKTLETELKNSTSKTHVTKEDVVNGELFLEWIKDLNRKKTSNTLQKNDLRRIVYGMKTDFGDAKVKKKAEILEDLVKKKSPKEKMETNMQRAVDCMPKKIWGLESYPISSEKKADQKKNREIISSFSFNLKKNNEIYSYSSKLNCGKVYVAAAKGKRNYMEDRFITTAIKFTSKDQAVHFGDVYAICDGHGGDHTVSYLSENLPSFLSVYLEKNVTDKSLDREEIFKAIKDACELLHNIVLKKDYEDGSTLIMAFKIKGQNGLFVACIGDSTALINRKGTPIPLSIEQKPGFISDQSTSVNLDKPNKYAKELMQNGVKMHKQEESAQEYADFESGKAMVMAYINSTETVHNFKLGNRVNFFLDMARSIGDRSYSKWMKSTPEMFYLELKEDDQLVMHSDGIAAYPHAIASVLETEKRNNVPEQEVVEFLVQNSIFRGDNVTAMIVDFDGVSKNSPIAPPSIPISVAYNAGFGHKLTLRGDWDGWKDDIEMRWTEGNVWIADVKPRGKNAAFKVLLDGKTWEQGANHTAKAGEPIRIQNINF